MNREKEIKKLLGNSFLLIRKNVKIKEDNKAYFLDYLFYNDLLKCYIVISVIRKDIKVEDIKKMSNYLKYVDELFRKDDNKTIGILLREKENMLSLDYISDFDRLRKVLGK